MSDASEPLGDNERDALRAAKETALVLVGEQYRSLCKMSPARFPRDAIERLVEQRLHFWRVPREVAELTFAGRARLDLMKSRAKNAARFADLAKSLRTS